MITQAYSVLGQIEGRRKTYLELRSTDFSSKLSLTCRGKVKFYKNVHHPIPTGGNREHPAANFQSKSVSFPFH